MTRIHGENRISSRFSAPSWDYDPVSAIEAGRSIWSSRSVVDGRGGQVVVGIRPARIVSLVPSLTELVFALGAGERLVGATRFCVEPPAARAVPRMGGTKNPDIRAIQAARPDLVLVNVEENRREDVDALAAAGIRVYVTGPRTVVEGIEMTARIGAVVGETRGGSAMAGRMENVRAAMVAQAAKGPPVRVFCPIWRRPWMSFNRHTFAHDMLATAGGENVMGDMTEPYPIVAPSAIQARRPEVVLLPSEPYRFGPRDLAPLAELLCAAEDALPPVRFIDGRALSWYGPRIDWGLGVLRANLLAAAGE